ncbi:TPA: hypothetical protein ACGVBC_004341, partial [Vibrio vulnificus]
TQRGSKLNLNFVEVPNQAILSSAKKYLLSAELIDSQNNQLELGAILCSSFSIELLLKSLLSTSSPQNVEQLCEDSWFYSGVTHNTAKGHSYMSLFHKLDLSIQEYLIASYNQENKQEPLISILKSYDGSFVKWRYGYETTTKSINITALLKLNRQLYDAISSLKISHNACV